MGYYIPDDMWESLSEQPRTVQNAVFGAVARLFFTGEEDRLTGVSKSIFVAFRDRVLKSRTNEGNRKGRTRNETRNETGNETGNETRNETNNETDNETRNETGTNAEGNPESAIKGGGGGGEELTKTVNSKPPIPPEAEEIVAYLNERAGTSYRASTRGTQAHIRARLAEGYTVADFKAAVDAKVADWGHDAKMRKYLRPETLFAPSKFEAYVNEGKGATAHENRFAKYD